MATNIEKIYLGTDGVVDLSLYAKKTDAVTPASLSSTLSGYVTSSSLTSTLGGYTTTAALNTALKGYATTASLSNYATTAALNAAIAGIVKLTVQVVASLPATGTENVLYLVPKSGAAGTNVKDEYLWIDGKWELIGSTAVDLSGYVTTAALNTALSPYAKTVDMNSAIATAKSETLTTAAATAQTKADAAKTAAVSTAAADAQTKADAAKSAAISTASSDATTKANNAKAGAVTDAKTYADATFAKVVTITQAAYNALATRDSKTLYLING